MHGDNMNELFLEECIFISDKSTQTEVFNEIYLKLLDKNLVKSEFLMNLLEREENYPTGIDLTVIDPKLPNIAIPHTESEFVNTTLIVPVKLKHAIEFNNMMDPASKLSVNFLFMILNNLEEQQSSILANIMDFFASTPVDELQHFFALEECKNIYLTLKNKFKKII